MAELGVNVAGRAQQSPAAIAALGARWARCVGYRDVNISEWIRGCRDHGVKVLMVLARESIDGDWERNLTWFRDLYSGRVHAVQIGNEPDHVSPSSWTMAPRDLNRLLVTARSVFGPDKLLIGPGLVSGHPGWAAQIDWAPVDGISLHPYAKDPGTPALDNLIAGYEEYGLPLWATEYHARTIGMAAALRDDPRIGVAMAFCMSDSMVPGFGMLEDTNALADFKAAAKVGGPPSSQHPAFQLGFLEVANRHPDIVGQPRENESGPWRNCSAQFTTKGLLLWGDFVAAGDQKGFIANDLTRYVWDGHQLRRVG